MYIELIHAVVRHKLIQHGKATILPFKKKVNNSERGKNK